MKVKYIYSACIEIKCNGFNILTDPWFTDGAYYGSWYQFPKIDPFNYISKPDLIYLSHIHPDHYDPTFLEKIFERFGEVDIVIPDLSLNYLAFKGKTDGFKLLPTRHFKNDYIELFIEENDTDSVSDIDSALIVKDLKTNKVLLNLNDCVYNKPHVDKLNKIISEIGGKLDFMALGYTGAGAYPQTYINLETDKDLLVLKAEEKKQIGYKRYLKYVETFNSQINLPFAGEYMIGGKLSYLNDYRGVADSFEVKEIDDKAIVLANGGTINLETNEILNERDSIYSRSEIEKRIAEIKDERYDYEDEIRIPIEKINFLRLIKSAAFKALAKSEIDGNYSFIFSVLDESSNIKAKFVLETGDSSIKELPIDEKITFEEYSEIKIDYRLFYGLLTAVYHWNNAEIGSHYFTNRVPLDSYNQKVQKYLNFFSTC